MTEPWQTDMQSGCTAQNSQEHSNPYHNIEELKTKVSDIGDSRNHPKHWGGGGGVGVVYVDKKCQ